MASCPFEDFSNIYDKIECSACPLRNSCGTASDFDKLLFEYVTKVLYFVDEALFKEDEFQNVDWSIFKMEVNKNGI